MDRWGGCGEVGVREREGMERAIERLWQPTLGLMDGVPLQLSMPLCFCPLCFHERPGVLYASKHPRRRYSSLLTCATHTRAEARGRETVYVQTQ